MTPPCSTPRRRRLAVILALWATVTARLVAGEPFVPASESTVLLRIPPGVAVPGPMPSRDELATTDPAAVAARVSAALDAAHLQADPRLLGRAAALLAPWEQTADVPAELLLLRAQVRQGLHQFREAQADLDQLLRREPRHAGAWLMKATLHQVRAEFPAARHACLQLARYGHPVVATTAAAALAGLTGVDNAPLLRLRATLESPAAEGVDASTTAWAWTTLGELHVLRGQPAEAESAFRTALHRETNSVYTLAALADLLLAANRPAEVAPLLGEPASDTLRLRLAEAEHRLDPGSARTRALRRHLSEAFELARLRRDDLHLREQARFLLRVAEDPRTAFAVARRNWDIQREPADLAVLLESAEASGARETAAEWRAWAASQMPGAVRHRQLTTRAGH